MSIKGTNIYYFSGTGNCLAAARQLAEELKNAEVIAITQELVDAKPSVECEKCVLIFPVYAYGPPPLVRKFLLAADFKCGYMAALSTCGTSSGGAFAAVKTLLKRKGQRLDYTLSIQTVENYVHIFGFPKPQTVTARTDRQRTLVKIAAEMIKTKGKNTVCAFRPFSRFFSIMFTFAAKRVFCKRYRVTEACTACGICEKICPSAAIKIQDGKPLFTAKKCDHCQGCLNVCPSKAIKFWKIKPASPRYVHPEVTAEELLKR